MSLPIKTIKNNNDQTKKRLKLIKTTIIIIREKSFIFEKQNKTSNFNFNNNRVYIFNTTQITIKNKKQ